MADPTTIFHHLQRQLFPALGAEFGALSALDQQFCEVMALTEPGRFTRRCEWCGNGAPPCPRTWLSQAILHAPNPKRKTPGAGRRVKLDRRGQQGEEELDATTGDIRLNLDWRASLSARLRP